MQAASFNRPTRRNLLLAASGLGFGGMIADGAVAQSGPDGGRPFSIEDYLNREEVAAIVADPAGATLAIQWRRSRNSGGFFGMPDWAYQPRCDILVADSELRGAARVTEGPEWYSNPIFSPDGTLLAMSRADRNGVVGLALWQAGMTVAQPLAPDLRIDTSVALTWSNERRSPIVWIDDRSLLVVEKHDDYLPRPLSDLANSQHHADAAARTQQGDLSVRRWRTADRTTCSPGSVLTRVDAKTGAKQALFTGDIRGASVSPDGRKVAFLVATGLVAEVPRGRMPVPLGMGGGGYEDGFVELALHVADLTTGETVQAPRFQATGQVSIESCPVWSADSMRFAVAVRTRYANTRSGDRTYLCTIDGVKLQAEAHPAVSPLDALVIAHLWAAADKADAANRRIAHRPQHGPQTEMHARSFGGWVARAGSTVVVAARQRIELLRPNEDEAQVLPWAATHAPVGGNANDLFCIVTRAGERARLHVASGGETITAVGPSPVGTGLTALIAPTGRRISVVHGERDSRMVLEESTEPVAEAFRWNRHFAEVRRPIRRAIRHPGAGGSERTGTLYLPTNLIDADGPFPVIVTAYPNSPPGVNKPIGFTNSESAWMIQPFLSAGFAVFDADFPVADAEDANSPFTLVAEAILPALDVFDQISEVDQDRIGFYGHSNGGYAALALGAQTDRFKAIIAAAPFPDSVEVDLMVTSEIRNLDCAPNVVQARRFYLESPYVPYAYATSPVMDARRFIDNSPLYNLSTYKTPTLLIYGENDATLPAIEKMFLALQTAGVEAELDTFWGESHILQTPANTRYAIQRQIDWMIRHL